MTDIIPNTPKKKTNILCVFCSKPYTQDMLDAYNDTYGCDTGCEYVRIIVKCDHCHRNVYVKGEFGVFENDDEKKEYLEEITEDDIKKALDKKYED